MLVLPAVAQAQEGAPAAAAIPSPDDQLIEFSADGVAYDSEADVITATGRVRMNRDGKATDWSATE